MSRTNGCDRREFIGAAGAVAALVPGACLIAWPARAAVAAPERLDDWTIDDMWGVYTRYAEPIPCGHTLDPRDLAADPLDALLSA